MRRFLPFNALSVNPKDHCDPSDLVVPSFDVLGMAVRQEFSSRHRMNCVRFESFRELPSEKGKVKAVERALAAFEEIDSAGFVNREPKPAYYVMEVERGETKTRGFVGMLEYALDPSATWFEAPFPGAEEDRLKQLEGFGIQTAPVTFGYRESGPGDSSLERALASVDGEKPLIEVKVAGHGHHRVWRLTKGVRDLEAHLAKKRLIILDGLDRWKAGEARSRMLAKEDKTPSPFKSYHFGMAWIVKIAPETVRFQPRHRTLRSAASPVPAEKLLEKLEDFFEIERYKLTQPGAKEAELVNLLDEMDLIGKLQHAYGFYMGDGAFYLMFLRDAEAYEKMTATQRSRRWKRLDVTVLHSLVFKDILGIGWQSAEDLAKFSMPSTPRRGVALVDDGFADSFFLLNPPPLEHLLELAESREEIPARSVVLESRPLIGTVMAEIDDHHQVGDSA